MNTVEKAMSVVTANTDDNEVEVRGYVERLLTRRYNNGEWYTTRDVLATVKLIRHRVAQNDTAYIESQINR